MDQLPEELYEVTGEDLWHQAATSCRVKCSWNLENSLRWGSDAGAATAVATHCRNKSECFKLRETCPIICVFVFLFLNDFCVEEKNFKKRQKRKEEKIILKNKLCLHKFLIPFSKALRTVNGYKKQL